METPLLDSTSSSSNADYQPVVSFEDAKSVFWLETVKLWKIAAPIVFQLVCAYGIMSITSIFVGHISEIELSGVSVALSVIFTFSFGFMLGMGSALETLCGQAYGAGQVYLLGVYMQRSWIILWVSCFFLLPIYIFATPILKLLGQEDEIADIAGKFAILIIPQLFALATSFPTQKFLQAQSKVIYVIVWSRDGWHGLSWAAFKDIWAFVRLSIASAVMLCLEIWYMMSIIIVTGHLNDAVTAVASLSICLNLNGCEGILFIGLNAAISVRVSNELGMGRPRAAKYSVYVTVFQSLLIGLFSMVVVILARDYFAVIFTSSKELQRAVSKLAYLLGITMVLNSVQPVISGVAVGGGWQALVAYINLGCYYGFGLPLGVLLGYTAHLGVMGVWGGMICGTALQTLLLLCVLYRTNWNKEVEQTTERMRKWGGQDLNKNDGGKIADNI
ncbi:hypothetical protein SLE2022_372910 [Rubroshorea leprosula]